MKIWKKIKLGGATILCFFMLLILYGYCGWAISLYFILGMLVWVLLSIDENIEKERKALKKSWMSFLDGGNDDGKE